MTIVFFARSAWKTFVMTKRLPFAVEEPLVAVMTPSALTAVVYGRLSTTGGGTKVPGTTQSDAGLVHKVEPYRSGHRPVRFNFDWSFDYYPLAYVRPGPTVLIYRLHEAACARP